MFKRILISTELTVCFFLTANAQTDTASYDLGRLSVKKQFTQSITIKGADLERMQFSDLADAINVWLYGTYSNASTLVYVIDGNIITDVNVYSIYDVDEVTLVQNALAQVSGASPGQQMVLIKLRTNRQGKQGVEAVGQTSMVNLRNQDNTPDEKTTVNVYDHYYLSEFKNYKNAGFIVSVDYQHDVLPQLRGSNDIFINPLHFNRIRLNGYATAKLWKGTSADFVLSYVPQQTSSIYDYTDNLITSGEADNNYYHNYVTQHLFSSNIVVRSRIVKGLVNTFSAAYTHYNYFENDSNNYVHIYTGSPTYYDNGYGGVNDKTSSLLLRDVLIYNTHLGLFNLESSVNLSDDDFHNSLADSSLTFGFLGSNQGIPSYNLVKFETPYHFKLALLTPSLNIYYKNIFNMQGGFVDILNSGPDISGQYSLQRISPFLTSSVDVLKLFGINNAGLRFFGSFSRENQLLTDNYSTLSGLGLTATPAANQAYNFNNSSQLPNFVNEYSVTNPYREYNNYQAGIMLNPFKNFTVNYSFEKKFYLAQSTIYTQLGGLFEIDGYGYYYNPIATNRIGLIYNFNSGGLTWKTSLNIAQSKVQIIDYPVFASNYNSPYLSSGHRYSGGFTNRITYKTLFAGVDILYQLGERPISIDNVTSLSPTVPPHINSFSLQNLYIGTQLNINHLKYAEVFANGRNILQNNSSDITDNRRFYRLGVKVGW